MNARENLKAVIRSAVNAWIGPGWICSFPSGPIGGDLSVRVVGQDNASAQTEIEAELWSKRADTWVARLAVDRLRELLGKDPLPDAPAPPASDAKPAPRTCDRCGYVEPAIRGGMFGAPPGATLFGHQTLCPACHTVGRDLLERLRLAAVNLSVDALDSIVTRLEQGLAVATTTTRPPQATHASRLCTLEDHARILEERIRVLEVMHEPAS